MRVFVVPNVVRWDDLAKAVAFVRHPLWDTVSPVFDHSGAAADHASTGRVACAHVNPLERFRVLPAGAAIHAAHQLEESLLASRIFLNQKLDIFSKALHAVVVQFAALSETQL